MKFNLGNKVRSEKLKLTDMIEFVDNGETVRLIFVKNEYDEYYAVNVETMEVVDNEDSLQEHYDFYSKKKGFKHYKNVYLGVDENE